MPYLEGSGEQITLAPSGTHGFYVIEALRTAGAARHVEDDTYFGHWDPIAPDELPEVDQKAYRAFRQAVGRGPLALLVARHALLDRHRDVELEKLRPEAEETYDYGKYDELAADHNQERAEELYALAEAVRLALNLDDPADYLPERSE